MSEEEADRSGQCARRPLAAAVVFAGMVALSFWLFRGVWRSPDRLVYGGQDALLFDWFLGWTPHALGAGINPLYTHAIGPPAGVNLMWNTPVPLLGALSAPLTALAGPVVTFNFWVTMGPALSGFACYLALRRWTRVVPAAVGGLLYGFCPVLIGQTGHVNLVVAVFPPLALMLLDDLFVRQHHPKRSAVLLGLACAAQLLVSSEVLLTTVLIAIVGLLLLVFLHRRRLPVAVSTATQRLALTAAVAVPLAAGPLAVQFLGAQRPVGPLHATGVSVTDLWTPLVPTPFQRISTPAMLRVSHRFTSNAVEVGGYLGLPLLVALVAVVIWRWRDPLVRWAALTGLVAMVLSFGPRLHVEGHVTAVRLPWAVLQRLPVMDSVAPSRIALFVVLMAAVIIARGLDSLPPRWFPAGAGATAIALAPLLPVLPYRPAPVPVPPFFATSAVNVIPKNGLVLAVPIPAPGQPQAMAWAAASHIRFRLIGCYCIVPGANGHRSFYPPPGPLVRLVQRISSGLTDTPATVPPQVAADLRQLSPAAVVLGPSPRDAQLRLLFDRLIGPPTSRTGDVTVWLTARS